MTNGANPDSQDWKFWVYNTDDPIEVEDGAECTLVIGNVDNIAGPFPQSNWAEIQCKVKGNMLVRKDGGDTTGPGA